MPELPAPLPTHLPIEDSAEASEGQVAEAVEQAAGEGEVSGGAG
jgi:hypothetical protein